MNAKSENANSLRGKPSLVQSEDGEPGPGYDDGEDTDEELSKSELAKQKNTVRKLNRIKEMVNNPEIGEQIQEMAQEQEQIENDADEALQNANQRSNQLKFLIGPDYKNLGELRKQVVHTRNSIRKLEKLQEKAGEDLSEGFDSAILALEQEAYKMQSQMYENLVEPGYSLFGWLFRWFSGFNPELVDIDGDTGTPVPLGTPVATVTGVPTATPVSTVTPVATATPVSTTTPTVTSTPTVTLDPGI